MRAQRGRRSCWTRCKKRKNAKNIGVTPSTTNMTENPAGSRDGRLRMVDTFLGYMLCSKDRG
jgi:hypothetical protein